MSPDAEPQRQRGVPYRGDDRFLIPGILAMFTVAILGSSGLITMAHIVIAVFLASGVSMLVFRFLGGINADTSFGLGAFRIGGSLAALVGCAWFFNGELRSTDIDHMFTPKYATWVPIDRTTGKLVNLKVNGKDLPYPAASLASTLGSVDLTILQGGKVAPSISKDHVLGQIDSNDLSSVSLSIPRKDIADYETSGYLHANSGPHSISNFPFKIHVGTFDHDRSAITIHDHNDSVVFSSLIFRQDYKLFTSGGEVFLVGVRQLDHNGYTNKNGDFVRPFVRVAMGNLSKSVQFQVN